MTCGNPTVQTQSPADDPRSLERINRMAADDLTSSSVSFAMTEPSEEDSEGIFVQKSVSMIQALPLQRLA